MTYIILVLALTEPGGTLVLPEPTTFNVVIIEGCTTVAVAPADCATGMFDDPETRTGERLVTATTGVT